MLVNQSKHVSTCFTEVHYNAQHTNMIHMFHINKHPHVMFGSRLNVTDIVRFHENTFASSSTQSPAIASQHAEVIGRIVVQFGSTLGKQAVFLLQLPHEPFGTGSGTLASTTYEAALWTFEEGSRLPKASLLVFNKYNIN